MPAGACRQLIETVCWTPAGRRDRVLVSNVGGARIGRCRARCEWRKRGKSSAEFVTSTARSACGVRNAYPQPSKLGVDRWLAMIGAHALEQRLPVRRQCRDRA